MISTVAESPPVVNWAGPSLLPMEALRENVSCGSIRISSRMAMLHDGIDKSPGALPAGRIVWHVTPLKSTPSIAREIVDSWQIGFSHKLPNFHDIKHHTKYTDITLNSHYPTISSPVAVSPTWAKAVICPTTVWANIGDSNTRLTESGFMFSCWEYNVCANRTIATVWDKAKQWMVHVWIHWLS